MAEVLLFHHALGPTEGLHAFANELRQARHTVHTPDLFEWRTFDSIEEGRIRQRGRLGRDHGTGRARGRVAAERARLRRLLARGRAAALVLFEILHRWEDEDADLQLLPGEQTALWDLSGALERVLVEPFHPGYTEIVQQARERLFASGGA